MGKLRNQELHNLHSSPVIKLSDQVRENDVGGACGTHRREEKSVTGFTGKFRREETTGKTET
jgi:hypothetical protein